MSADAYRLWQGWQQMHYPRLCPAPDEIEGVDLVAIDGRAGACLEGYFRRGGRGAAPNRDIQEALEQCASELGRVAGRLHGDAARYFGRLHELLRLVMAEPAETVG
ncbi:MAG: hypothetical protein ACRDJ9_18555 [Dehalococcoidia bacterium]